MHLFAASWAVLLLPLAGLGASYLAETRRGSAVAVVAASWLTLLATLVVLFATVAGLPTLHQSSLTFWTFPVTQTPFNSAASTLLSPNFQVGVGYWDTPAATVLAVAVVIAVLFSQTQMMSQLRSDQRLAGLMRLTAILLFGALSLILAPGLFQVVVGFELCGFAAALILGSGLAAQAGAVARRTYVAWRVGALSLLLGVVFIYVKFSGAIEVASTSAKHPAKALSPNGLNLASLAAIWTAATHGQVHGVGGRTLTLAAVLIVLAVVCTAGLIPFHGLWRGLTGAPGGTAGALLAVLGVALAAALADQVFPLMRLAPGVLPALTVLAAISGVVMAALAVREPDLRRFGAFVASSLSASVLVGFGLGSPSAAVAMAVSSIVTIAALMGAVSHLSRDLRIQTVRRLRPAWSQARGAVWILLGSLLAAVGLVGSGTFFGRSALLAASISGAGRGFPNPDLVVRLAGGGGELVSSLLVAWACGRVAAAALRGPDLTDPREARAARRHLSQARPGSQIPVLQGLVVVSLLSGLVSLPAIRFGIGTFLASGKGHNIIPFDWLAIGASLILPLLVAAAALATTAESSPGMADEGSWVAWADGARLTGLLERALIGWPGRALVFLTLRVLDPLSDSAVRALEESPLPPAPERSRLAGWRIGAPAAALGLVIVAVGILVWVGAVHPAAVGAP